MKNEQGGLNGIKVTVKGQLSEEQANQFEELLAAAFDEGFQTAQETGAAYDPEAVDVTRDLYVQKVLLDK